MIHVVTEACIRCKYTDYAEVCPADCFYEGENVLVINSRECIDCGIRLVECPVDAILQESEGGLERWLESNACHARTWPKIIGKKEVPADANRWVGAINKFEFFSIESGRAA